MLFPISEAYELNIRQGPEKARVAGIKEKGEGSHQPQFSVADNCPCFHPDRKPVDPPPIIQLHIRDPSDPSQLVPHKNADGNGAHSVRNYLQSPYYFMVCNLWDPVDSRTAQTGSQTVLAGTLVSSLHRLKDVDNTGNNF